MSQIQYFRWKTALVGLLRTHHPHSNKWSGTFDSCVFRRPGLESSSFLWSWLLALMKLKSRFSGLFSLRPSNFGSPLEYGSLYAVPVHTFLIWIILLINLIFFLNQPARPLIFQVYASLNLYIHLSLWQHFINDQNHSSFYLYHQSSSRV